MFALASTWGFIKQQVYQPPLPPTIGDLRVRIIEAIALVDGPMLQRVWQEIDYRLDVCHLSTALAYQQPAACFKTETPDASRSRDVSVEKSIAIHQAAPEEGGGQLFFLSLPSGWDNAKASKPEGTARPRPQFPDGHRDQCPALQ
ncbi:hypothetical protein ANN_19805 [Periplaneta americana]|uniref:Uncharacterized protein n=1 Tax=Periplaneta americana TaxID=6978 RepID=A0ABQ8SB48_PERAM|nr:hypothetical protein ANN_19805 [Periplaneta americana]